MVLLWHNHQKTKSGYPLFHLQFSADEESLGTAAAKYGCKGEWNDEKTDVGRRVGVGHDYDDAACDGIGGRYSECRRSSWNRIPGTG